MGIIILLNSKRGCCKKVIVEFQTDKLPYNVSDQTNTKRSKPLGHLHCSKEPKKYKHLSYQNRLRIEVLLKDGIGTKEIR